jgi:Glycosyltransferase WbsX
MPGWDNTPRRPDRARIYINASPEVYEVCLREVVERLARKRAVKDPLIVHRRSP